jgi:hypothetical protein
LIDTSGGVDKVALMGIEVDPGTIVKISSNVIVPGLLAVTENWVFCIGV